MYTFGLFLCGLSSDISLNNFNTSSWLNVAWRYPLAMPVTCATLLVKNAHKIHKNSKGWWSSKIQSCDILEIYMPQKFVYVHYLPICRYKFATTSLGIVILNGNNGKIICLPPGSLLILKVYTDNTSNCVLCSCFMLESLKKLECSNNF